MECFLPCLWDGRNALPCGTQGLDKKPSIAWHILKPVCLGDKPRLPCHGATLPLLRDRAGEMRSAGSQHAAARERPCWPWGWRWGFRAPACDTAGTSGVSSHRGAFLLGQGRLNLCSHCLAASTAVTGRHNFPSWGSRGTVPALVFCSLVSRWDKAFADPAIIQRPWGCSCC